ncbi:hypothetical protein FRC02_012259, partial [Tulasnella sp. 418]
MSSFDEDVQRTSVIRDPLASSTPHSAMKLDSSSSRGESSTGLFSYTVKSLCSFWDRDGHYNEIQRLLNEKEELEAVLEKAKTQMEMQSKALWRRSPRKPTYYFDELMMTSTRLKAAEDEIRRLESDAHRLSSELCSIQEGSNSQQQEVEDLKAKLARVQEESDSSLDQLSKENSEYRAREEVVLPQLEQTRVRIRSLEKSLNVSMLECEESKESNKDLVLATAVMSKAKSQLESGLTAARSELHQALMDKNKLAKELLGVVSHWESTAKMLESQLHGTEQLSRREIDQLQGRLKAAEDKAFSRQAIYERKIHHLSEGVKNICKRLELVSAEKDEEIQQLTDAVEEWKARSKWLDSELDRMDDSVSSLSQEIKTLNQDARVKEAQIYNLQVELAAREKEHRESAVVFKQRTRDLRQLVKEKEAVVEDLRYVVSTSDDEVMQLKLQTAALHSRAHEAGKLKDCLDDAEVREACLISELEMVRSESERKERMINKLIAKLFTTSREAHVTKTELAKVKSSEASLLRDSQCLKASNIKLAREKNVLEVEITVERVSSERIQNGLKAQVNELTRKLSSQATKEADHVQRLEGTQKMLRESEMKGRIKNARVEELEVRLSERSAIIRDLTTKLEEARKSSPKPSSNVEVSVPVTTPTAGTVEKSSVTPTEFVRAVVRGRLGSKNAASVIGEVEHTTSSKQSQVDKKGKAPALTNYPAPGHLVQRRAAFESPRGSEDVVQAQSTLKLGPRIRVKDMVEKLEKSKTLGCVDGR